MSRSARKPNLLPLPARALALALMLAGCGGGGGSTAGAPPPGVPVDPPRDVTATGADGSVTVSWSAATGAASYILYWSNSPEITRTTGNRVTNVTNPFLHGGLPVDEDFYYVVTSVGGTGVESAESAVAFAWSAASHVPGPDVGQYFDRGLLAGGAQGYDDRSSHPLRGLTTPDNTLRFGGRNCLACHYASGPARAGDECLMCHFENQPNAPAGNHRNRVIELATITGTGLPTAPFTITTIQEYDAWCLQCHRTTPISLGGVFPSSARRTVLDPAAVANGRHRAQSPPVGCIHCHHPHGRSNAKLVRENPANRGSAPAIPTRFGVFPGDATGTYTGNFIASPNENRPYRARVDNTAPDVQADADDDAAFCNKACHVAKVLASQTKEKSIKRDDTTGLYILTPTNLKIYTINGQDYTRDNVSNFIGFHGHVAGDIISTDNMVDWYATAIGQTGPARYRYPGTGTADPASFGTAASPLPFFPDFGDGIRDFTNGYLDRGLIRYRFSCSTCHDPHGTTSPNTAGGIAYPDLRLPRTGPGSLCKECHR